MLNSVKNPLVFKDHHGEYNCIYSLNITNKDTDEVHLLDPQLKKKIENFISSVQVNLKSTKITLSNGFEKTPFSFNAIDENEYASFVIRSIQQLEFEPEEVRFIISVVNDKVMHSLQIIGKDESKVGTPRLDGFFVQGNRIHIANAAGHRIHNRITFELSKNVSRFSKSYEFIYKYLESHIDDLLSIVENDFTQLEAHAFSNDKPAQPKLMTFSRELVKTEFLEKVKVIYKELTENKDRSQFDRLVLSFELSQIKEGAACRESFFRFTKKVDVDQPIMEYYRGEPTEKRPTIVLNELDKKAEEKSDIKIDLSQAQPIEDRKDDVVIPDTPPVETSDVVLASERK